MVKYKVSAVSYLNTIPFIHGIKSSNIYDSIDLQLDFPSECARKLSEHEIDIALVPVAVLKQNPSFNIVSDFCIGADGDVDTVCLYSNVPLEEKEVVSLTRRIPDPDILVSDATFVLKVVEADRYILVPLAAIT